MTGAIAQTVNSRLLSSRLGRSTISAAISLAILAVAAFILYELLRDIEFGKVVAALKAQSIGKIAHRRRVRRRRLRHADVLRFVRAARDRPAQSPLRRRRVGELHKLHDRSQLRRRRPDRRPDQVAHLFVLGLDRARHRQDRIHDRHDFLARQCVSARRRHRLRAGGGRRRRSSAGMDQPRDRVGRHCSRIGCYLLWLAPRPRAVGRAGLADRIAQSALHAAADRHRRARS